MPTQEPDEELQALYNVIDAHLAKLDGNKRNFVKGTDKNNPFAPKARAVCFVLAKGLDCPNSPAVTSIKAQLQEHYKAVFAKLGDAQAPQKDLSDYPSLYRHVIRDVIGERQERFFTHIQQREWDELWQQTLVSDLAQHSRVNRIKVYIDLCSQYKDRIKHSHVQYPKHGSNKSPSVEAALEKALRQGVIAVLDARNARSYQAALDVLKQKLERRVKVETAVGKLADLRKQLLTEPKGPFGLVGGLKTIESRFTDFAGQVDCEIDYFINASRKGYFLKPGEAQAWENWVDKITEIAKKAKKQAAEQEDQQAGCCDWFCNLVTQFIEAVVGYVLSACCGQGKSFRFFTPATEPTQAAASKAEERCENRQASAINEFLSTIAAKPNYPS